MRVLFSKRLAVLSKPRCGSTSLRRMLAPFVNREAGDIIVNRGDEMPPFHPHITAPFLKKVLQEKGYDPQALKYVITIRHPVEMLWSYYKFFKPDTKSRYTFSAGWNKNSLMDFDEWIFSGRLNPLRMWQDLAPDWIKNDDLSSLSLEFRAMNRQDKLEVDKVFPIEDQSSITSWFEKHLGCPVDLGHYNQSRQQNAPDLGNDALKRIQKMLPYESDLYEIKYNAKQSVYILSDKAYEGKVKMREDDSTTNNVKVNLDYQKARTSSGGSYTESKLKRLNLPSLSGKRFLDLGCNTGFYCRWAYQQGAAHVVGVDNSPQVIEQARSQSPAEIIFRDTGWDDFPHDCYDVVILLSAIHYANNPRDVVRNIRRSLKDDGLLVLEGGILFADEDRITDLPLPGWRKVGDRCLHLTHGFINNHLLLDFEWNIIGDSEMRGGDDVPRYVIHASPSDQEAENKCFNIDVLDFFSAAKQSALTIIQKQPAYEYVSKLKDSFVIDGDYVSKLLADPNIFSIFMNDLNYCIDSVEMDELILHETIDLKIIDKIAQNISKKTKIKRHKPKDMSPEPINLDWYVNKLSYFSNNSDFHDVSSKRILFVSKVSNQTKEYLSNSGAGQVKVILVEKQDSRPLLSKIISELKKFPKGSFDLIFLDISQFDLSDFVSQFTLFFDQLRRVLIENGVVFSLFIAGKSERTFDVGNNVALSEYGWLPTRNYLYDVVLKKWTIRTMLGPVPTESGFDKIALRISPKKPIILLVCGKSMAGKTTLAREFNKLHQGMHISNDYIYVQLVKVAKKTRQPMLSDFLRENLGDGSGQSCGHFNRSLEANPKLLDEYIHHMLSNIPVNYDLISIDLDFRTQEGIARVKERLTEAGFLVWTIQP
jgi:SAM-dependent methyltransferase